MKIFLKTTEWQDTTDIYITEDLPDGSRVIAKPMKLIFEKYVKGKQYDPTLSISRYLDKKTNFLQALSDALTEAGFQPKVEQEIKGELKATKSHLEDMRALVFKNWQN